MKSKAIISLIVIAALVFSAAIALAENFVANPLTSVSGGGWQTTNGSFNTNSGNNGIISTANYSRAIHQVTTDTSGAFTFESTWKINNDACDVHPGVSTGAESSDICVGYSASWKSFVVVIGNSQVKSLGGIPDPNAVYTSKITSTDGNTFTCGVYKDGALQGTTTTVTGYKPTYVSVWIENIKPVTNGPTVYSVNFTSTTTATATPTTSPTPTTTPTKVSYDLQAIRDFYAKQPVQHMSNQSVVYNPDGTIKQVITESTIPAASPTVQPTITPNATATVTATPAPANATAVPSTPVAPTTPAPTKAQSPGFEIVLATLGMIAAMALITRKKK